MPISNNEFLERLEFVRKKNGITQKKLGELAGISATTISRWKRPGAPAPDPKSIKAVSSVIGCDLIWLATGRGEPFPGVIQRAKVVAKKLAGQGVPITQTLAEQQSRYGDQLEQDANERRESINEEEAVEQTLYVLRSNTVYRGALLSNIRAFFRGVKKEEEMEGIGELLLKMQEKHESDMRELKELIKAKNEIDPQKRDKIANS